MAVNYGIQETQVDSIVTDGTVERTSVPLCASKSLAFFPSITRYTVPSFIPRIGRPFPLFPPRDDDGGSPR